MRHNEVQHEFSETIKEYSEAGTGRIIPDAFTRVWKKRASNR